MCLFARCNERVDSFGNLHVCVGGQKLVLQCVIAVRAELNGSLGKAVANCVFCIMVGTLF